LKIKATFTHNAGFSNPITPHTMWDFLTNILKNKRISNDSLNVP